MLRRLALHFVGNKNTFPLSFWLLKKVRTLAFGNLWDFKNNGEMEVVEMIAKQIGISVFFDVGANNGEYSLWASQKTRAKDVQFHLFEPSPDTFLKLDQCQFGSLQVVKNKLALGKNPDGQMDFFVNSLDTLSGFYPRNSETDQKISVPVTNLDRYTEKKSVSSIDFLKIDVEGHEVDVLYGAKGLLSGKKIKAIQFEFGFNNTVSRTFFKDFYELLSPDFDLYLIQRGGLVPVLCYDYEWEAFGKVSNYLAVLKELKFDPKAT